MWPEEPSAESLTAPEAPLFEQGYCQTRGRCRRFESGRRAQIFCAFCAPATVKV
jgi:hypothetical protein